MLKKLCAVLFLMCLFNVSNAQQIPLLYHSSQELMTEGYKYSYITANGKLVYEIIEDGFTLVSVAIDPDRNIAFMGSVSMFGKNKSLSYEQVLNNNENIIYKGIVQGQKLWILYLDYDNVEITMTQKNNIYTYTYRSLILVRSNL
jgi:hypothetical protein